MVYMANKGHFSKNHTYTIRNYLTGALLYVVHVCMRGEDDLVEGELYKGTLAEGYAADLKRMMVCKRCSVLTHPHQLPFVNTTR